MIYKCYTAHTTNAKILVWEIKESTEELRELLGNFEVYSEEYANIRLEKRRLEFLAARVAINTLLKREVRIIYNDEEKPFLSDNSQQISISHSENRVAVMSHPEMLVGIDIEKRGERFLKVYKRYLSEKEQADLNFGENALLRLQLAWSAKEAMYKVFGRETLDFANDLRMLSFEPQNNGFLDVEHVKQKTVYTLQYVTDKDFNLVWSGQT